ncbi:MAG: tryptophan--tRNA ligase [Gammaproteobacteria bacterium]
MTQHKPILLSGIQPSGQLTIGHYAGAIASWLAMQRDFDCLFMLVDLHTLTVKQEPAVLRERCYDMLALYIACGIDPEQNILFIQSHVPEHTQLAWVLNCFTQMGELNRMTQFKDKSQRHAHNINAGLFTYPVLMAADILLHGTERVPVGEDQKQHLELTRDLALRFNHYYGDTFVIPQPYIPPQGARIMSLQEPTVKMSKSDNNENSYITLLDSPEVITKKLKRCVTDSGSEVYFDPQQKPGISNLLTILSVFSSQPIAQLEETYRTGGYGKFKTAVTDAIISHLTPIQQRYQQLRQDEQRLNNILSAGAEKARQRASRMLQRVYDLLGLIPAHPNRN